VPSADIGSHGPYGVYHSAFDDFAWFTRFADPTFAYEQQMARFFGLETLRMAGAELLPFDYELYAGEVREHLERVKLRAGPSAAQLDFAAALKAADRFGRAAAELRAASAGAQGEKLARANAALMAVERAMLGAGLPHRPWFRHTIFAPGEYTGYAAVVLPGVNEALDRQDTPAATAALKDVTAALERAAAVLRAAL
jgi:N-acetylated-alpha-linked acidic dipeptidase